MTVRPNRSVQNLNLPEEEDLLSCNASPDMKQSTSLDLGLTWTKTGGTFSYTMGNSKIHFQMPVVMAVIVIAFGLILLASMASYRKTAASILDHDHPHRQPVPGYPFTKPKALSRGTWQFRIALVADLDVNSKMINKSNDWRSIYKNGLFNWNSVSRKVEIEWQREANLTGSLAAGGRGMELSELVTFDGRLLTMDDRTGVIYQLHLDGNVPLLTPWVVLPDGNGTESKGFKCEWATVKDDHLYVGGLGKEWTTPEGRLMNFNPMFVKRISAKGEVEHLDWHRNYERLRSSVGIEFPGYMIHEAIVWSDVHQEWFSLPRRASKNKYNEIDDERRGTNYMLRADSNFEGKIKVTRVGELNETHGFSSFKFVPGTKDTIIVAVKTEELQGKESSYIMAFDIDGNIIQPETKISDNKFEGIEFV